MYHSTSGMRRKYWAWNWNWGPDLLSNAHKFPSSIRNVNKYTLIAWNYESYAILPFNHRNFPCTTCTNLLQYIYEQLFTVCYLVQPNSIHLNFLLCCILFPFCPVFPFPFSFTISFPFFPFLFWFPFRLLCLFIAIRCSLLLFYYYCYDFVVHNYYCFGRMCPKVWKLLIHSVCSRENSFSIGNEGNAWISGVGVVCVRL